MGAQKMNEFWVLALVLLRVVEQRSANHLKQRGENRKTDLKSGEDGGSIIILNFTITFIFNF